MNQKAAKICLLEKLSACVHLAYCLRYAVRGVREKAMGWADGINENIITSGVLICCYDSTVTNPERVKKLDGLIVMVGTMRSALRTMRLFGCRIADVQRNISIHARGLAPV